MKTEINRIPAEVVYWQTGIPDVPVGRRRRLWCLAKATNATTAYHQLLTYCNRHVMPLSDSASDEPPEGVEPVLDSEGDYYWNGWFEESCDVCDTQWAFNGEVIAWMKLPKLKL